MLIINGRRNEATKLGGVMFGASKSALDARRSSNTNGLTGLERAKLERSMHGDEPQNRAVPQSPTAQTAPIVVPKPAAAPVAQPAPAPGSDAHLYAGPGIKLKGDIVGCDTLRIEGIVDGNAIARQLILCPGGSFLGTADIEEAEIEGSFDGTLNVRGRLVLRNNGRIAGTLSYGEIEIERGGEITGQITPHGEQIAAKSRSQTAFAPASDERRVGFVPKPLPQSFVQAPRPEQAAAAAAPPPAAETPAKARKALFFGSS
jgi:cytoskeletal protein CcmA (bactofilin family)